MFLKKPAEVESVLVSDHGSYVGNVVVGGLKEHLRIADPDRKNIFHRRYADCVLKAFVEPADAHVPRKRIFLDADLFVVMLREVLFGEVDLLTRKARKTGKILFHPPVHRHEEFPKQIRKHFCGHMKEMDILI